MSRRAAVLLRDQQPEVTLLGEQLDVVPRHLAVLIPARGADPEDFARELARLLAQQLLFLGQFEIHRAEKPPECGMPRIRTTLAV